MGEFVTQEEEFVYRQADGEITAWFGDFEEKMELPHEGSPRYKKIFYFLVLAGLIYLALIFISF